jgi:hypothetical protein
MLKADKKHATLLRRLKRNEKVKRVTEKKQQKRKGNDRV